MNDSHKDIRNLIVGFLIGIVVAILFIEIVPNTNPIATAGITRTTTVILTSAPNSSGVYIGFINHLLTVESSANKSQIMKMYFTNATLVVKGIRAQGLQGSYVNNTGITAFLQGLSGLQNKTLLIISFSYTFEGNNIIVNSTFILNGVPPKSVDLYLPFVISAEVTFVSDRGDWLISNEIWNFKKL